MSSLAHFWFSAKVGLILLAVWLVYRIIIRAVFVCRIRSRFTDIPQLPRHWFWGHLATVGPKLSPDQNAHPDYGFEEVWNELGKPPVYMCDFAPIDRAMLVISDPGVAENITQVSPRHKYSVPKSDTLQALTTLVGDSSLVLLDGERWKDQRRKYNKGFAPSYLNSMVPMILSKSKVFLDCLKHHAEMGDVFQMQDPSSDLTTDIITEMAIEKDFHAQSTAEGQGHKSKWGFLTVLRIMSTLTSKLGQGGALPNWAIPSRAIREWLYDKLYTRAIMNEILPRLKDSSDGSGKYMSTAGRSVIQMALAGEKATPKVLNEAVSQVKTFLFAGQDTTSTTIQWMAYELSKSYPSSPLYSKKQQLIRERLFAEHDAVFGAGPFSALDLLSDPTTNVDEVLGSKLPYTTAFVKEALRLHPPGGSARVTPLAPYDPDVPSEGSPEPFFLDVPAWKNYNTGEEHEASRVRADGLRLYVNHFQVQRNPVFWGPDVLEFDPARFLEIHDDKETSHPYHISKLPIGSYRPFERGPRGCIGSNLAYIEAKIVLAIMARGFEFVKVGLDGRKPKAGEAVYNGTGREDLVLGEKRGWQVWSINNVTSVPVDGMRMKLKLRSLE